MSSESHTIQSRFQTKSILLSVVLVLCFGGVSSTHAQWTSSGGNTTTSDKVGIGTTSPGFPLEVNGDIAAVSSFDVALRLKKSGYKEYLLRTAASGLSFIDSSSGTELTRMFLDGSGNVGIGTTSPAGKLHVVGSIAISKGFYGADITDETGRIGLGWYWDATTGNSTFLKSSEGTTQILATQSKGIQLLGGNVGIGTTNPSTFKLQVAGDIGGNSDNTSSLGSSGVRFNSGYFGDGGASIYGLNNSNPLLRVTQFGSNYAATFTGGNVGIGTTAPTDVFQVTKNSNAALRVIDGAAYGGSYSGLGIQAIDNAGTALKQLVLGATSVVFPNGVVGVGVATPFAPLQVNTATNHNLGVRDAASYGTQIYGANDANSAYAGLLLDGAPLLFNPFSGGNVGIGTTSPGSYRLNVNGDTNVSGNLNIVANGSSAGNIVAAGTINAKYQDVAEWVPSSEPLAAGTVVVLDSTKSNQVTSSSVSYDTRVAGVISEQPGIALGEQGEGKVLVATTGRVRVKVDATKGPIHIGDLLVTSDVPGMAMKSESVEFSGRKMHMPGTLIGKALEHLEKGKGEILVLLSLQ